MLKKVILTFFNILLVSSDARVSRPWQAKSLY
jgi:hypothetical protein